MPPLPPKSLIRETIRLFTLMLFANSFQRDFDQAFWRKEEQGLNIFSSRFHSESRQDVSQLTDHSCVMLNPEFSSAPVLKEFLFN